ncbi:helix-turn-helix domain-containing protein [Arthrobacter sp. NPDC093139]|uniref:helix-turn-helix domain-containing protein n=1 Tax=Arthrobacter sp. NPDC093139 TaxID=3363945 RepID=UPI003827270E
MLDMTEEARPLRFLTIEQVAQELNVSQIQVRALLRSGELRGFQVGGRGIWRIGVDDVEAYIDEAYRRTAENLHSGELQESIPASGQDD